MATKKDFTQVAFDVVRKATGEATTPAPGKKRESGRKRPASGQKPAKKQLP
jgi:hypothetical protein